MRKVRGQLDQKKRIRKIKEKQKIKRDQKAHDVGYYRKPRRIASNFAIVDVGKLTALKRIEALGVSVNYKPTVPLKDRLKNWEILKKLGIPVARKIAVIGKKRNVKKKIKKRDAIVFEKLRILNKKNVFNHIPEVVQIVKNISKGKYVYDWKADNFGIDKHKKLKLADFSHVNKWEGYFDWSVGKMFSMNIRGFINKNSNMPLIPINSGISFSQQAKERTAKIRNYILKSKDKELKKIASAWLKRNQDV